MTVSDSYSFVEGIAVAFFGIMAVLNLQDRHNRLRRILGWVLIYWFIQHIVSVVMTADILSGSRFPGRMLNIVDTTAEPTCVFILMELSRPGWLTWRKIVWNELPFIVLGAANFFYPVPALYYCQIIFFVCYGLAYLVATLVNISRYNVILRQTYSYDENVNLRWLYIVLGTFLVLMLVYAAIMLFDTTLADIVYVSGSILAWAWICYCIQRQESILQELEAMEKETETTDGAAAADTPLPVELERAVKVRFIEPQLYLNPHLKLGDMAQAIGTNRTYLSRYLNERLHTSFYDYINGLRLAFATNLLRESDLNISTIAQMAGFNSYSTFRRCFLARYGMAPLEYRANPSPTADAE